MIHRIFILDENIHGINFKKFYTQDEKTLKHY